MLPSYILSLREGFEAALIIAIVLGALHKTDHLELRRNVWFGLLAALGLSSLIALGLDWIGTEFRGKGEMLFEGTSMLLASLLLTWMIFWVGRQNRSLKAHLESGVRQAVLQTGASAIFLLVFVSVLREGTELAVFLLAARLASGAWSSISGALLGLATAGFAGWLVFRSSHRLNLKRFFTITNIMLMFFAAGLVVQGVREFIEAGWLQIGLVRMWDISFLLTDHSLPGQVLGTLFGYNSSPSLIEVIAYVGYFLLLGVALRLSNARQASPVKIA